jgi:ribosomal protein L33
METRELIKRLRHQHLTYQKIANIVHLSRQRVYQIYPNEKFKQAKPKIKKQCPVCNKIFYVHPSQQKQIYCSRKCWGQVARKYGDKKEKNRIRGNLYYWEKKGDITKSKYYQSDRKLYKR